jgi:hypothetical protein
MKFIGNRNHNHYLVLLIIFLIYLVSFIYTPKDGFWIVDNGNKFIQMKSFIKNGYTSTKIPWEGKKYDPDLQFNPLPYQFSIVQNREIYSIFPPAFAVVSAFLYRLMGQTGIYIIPFLALFATLWITTKICRLLEFDRKLISITVFTLALATPLWFYSLEFWEHNIVVFLVCCAIYFALVFRKSGKTRDLVFSISLSSIVIYFRDELYLLLVVICFSLCFFNRKNILRNLTITAATFFCIILPLFLIQDKLTGMALGAHLGKHIGQSTSLVNHFMDRPKVIYNLLLAMAHPKILSSLFQIIYLLLISLFLFIKDKKKKYVFLICTFLVIFHSILLIISTSGDNAITKLLDSNGLFAASPFLLLVFFKTGFSNPYDVENKNMSLIKFFVFFFLLLYILAAPVAGSSGIHWGCRFLLILYPLLVIILVYQFKDTFNGIWSLKKGAVWMGLILACFLQLSSIKLLHDMKIFNRDLNRFITSQSERIIITDQWHVPQELSFHFFDSMIFYFNPNYQVTQINQLLKGFKNQKIKSILFISTPSNRYGNVIKYFRFRGSNLFNYKISRLIL